MKPTTVVAFVARAGHGKTTCASVLERKFGARRISFAGPLKRLAQKIWGLEDRFLYGTQEEKLSTMYGMAPSLFVASERISPYEFSRTDPSAEEYQTTPRKLMQDLGTWLREELYKDVWVETALRTINETIAAPLWVIDDLRYPNEAWQLRAAHTREEIDLKIVHVVCQDAPRSPFADHPSERSVELIGKQFADAMVSWTLDQPEGTAARECQRVLEKLGLVPSCPVAGSCPLCDGTGLKKDAVTCSCVDDIP